MGAEPGRLGVLLDRAKELVGNIESTWDGAEAYTLQDQVRLAHKIADDPSRRVALTRLLADLDRFVRGRNNPVSDPGAQVLIDNTSLYAYLTLLPPRLGHPLLTRIRLDRAFTAAGVRVGLDRAAVEGAFAKFAQRREIVYRLRVASGTLPRRGEDGALAPCVPILQPDQLASGRAPSDLAALLRGVKEKTLIARIVAAGAGVPGVTVTGKEIPAPPGRACAVAPGDGTIVHDREEIVAARAGVPTLRGGRLEVEPWEVHAGGSRVDSSRGVLLAGDHVAERVRARDLCVDGDLEGAHVEVSGSLYVRGDVRNGARVRVGGSAWVRGIASAEIEAGGDVRVAKGATSSIVVAGGRVEAGEVVGGTVIALVSVQARRVGSDWGERTKVTVGRGRWLERRREGRAQALSEARRALDAAVRAREERAGGRDPRDLPAAEQDAVLAALLEESRLRKEVARLEAEETDARRSGPGVPEPSIRILDGLLPPVVLEIDGQHLTIKEPKGPLVALRENLASFKGRETRARP